MYVCICNFRQTARMTKKWTNKQTHRHIEQHKGKATRACNTYIGRGPTPCPWTLTCSQTVICSLSLPFGLHPRLHRLLLICQPQRDGRLSWLGWLTHSGHFTQEVVACQTSIRCRSCKSPAKDQRPNHSATPSNFQKPAHDV